MARSRKAILTHKKPELIGGKIKWLTQKWVVQVLSVVGIHAMVRRPGAAPFVCDSRKLEYTP